MQGRPVSMHSPAEPRTARAPGPQRRQPPFRPPTETRAGLAGRLTRPGAPCPHGTGWNLPSKGGTRPLTPEPESQWDTVPFREDIVHLETERRWPLALVSVQPSTDHLHRSITGRPRAIHPASPHGSLVIAANPAQVSGEPEAGQRQLRAPPPSGRACALSSCDPCPFCSSPGVSTPVGGSNSQSAVSELNQQ